MPTVVVIGSLNHDTTFFVPAFGSPGASTISTSCIDDVGGKGANQALAAQRLSSKKHGLKEKKINVKMIGAVGEDEWGDKLFSTLERDGVDVSQLRRVQQPTGKASIQVEVNTGDSQVLLDPGANYSLDANDFNTLEDIGGKAGAKPDLLILQLEIKTSVVEKILEISARHEIAVLLNPAPADKILGCHWKAITHLVANEGEAAVMAGKDTTKLPAYKRGWQEIVDELHQKGVKYVVITLAANGVFYSISGTSGGTHVGAKNVPVVDSTTAGDTFIGAYASKFVQSRGKPFNMGGAIDFALRAAAHVVQRLGTQVTIPWGSDLLDRRGSAALTQLLRDSSHDTIKNARDVILDHSKDEYKVEDKHTSQTVEQIEGEQRRSFNEQKQFENRYGVGYKLICQTEEQIKSEQRRGSNEQEELSMREEVPDEASDDAASSYSTIFSEFSTSSASSYASRSITLTAAIDEVVILFLEDKVVHRLFSSALAKEERHKVLKGIADLLNWLGRRLTNASGSQIEKELAKLFSSPKRNYAIILKISNEIEFINPDGEKREQMKKLRNQEISLEHLEKYLEKQAGYETLNVFSDKENDISKDEETGGSDYEEEEDGEADGSQNMTSNIEAAKKFLKSSDAFSRFKEELEDFAEPFKSEPIWNKILWDGDERVRFELSHTRCRLTNMDKLKLTAEETLRMPILWWPLKQPRKYLPSSKVRIIWACVG